LIAFLGYFASQIALVWLTWRDPLLRSSQGEAATLALAWVFLGGLAIWRGTLVMSLTETFIGLALTGVAVLVVTLGRPALVMVDVLNLSDLPLASRRRLRNRGRVTQALLIAAIVVVAWFS
jgi:hypothetical protein